MNQMRFFCFFVGMFASFSNWLPSIVKKNLNIYHLLYSLSCSDFIHQFSNKRKICSNKKISTNPSCEIKKKQRLPLKSVIRLPPDCYPSAFPRDFLGPGVWISSWITGHTWRIIPFSKWLITMVSKSPNWGCSPSKWPKWLINGGY